MFPWSEALFACECCKALHNLPGSSDLSWSRKELYWELVVGSALNHLMERLSWSLEEFRYQWNWAPGLGFLNNFEFSLIWRLARNALPLADWAFKADLADMPDCLRCGSVLEEQLCKPSTTASGFARFEVTSGIGWLALIPNSLCCLCREQCRSSVSR